LPSPKAPSPKTTSGPNSGGVIVGAQDGRSSDDDITLFESVGVGLQDLATAELVVARAEELGVGMMLDLGA
jgi:ornithine cyclodeaminase/alanine dehydrogenase